MLKRWLLVAILCGLLVSACSKKSVIRRYYVIEMPALETQNIQGLQQFDYKVDVRDFRVGSAFDQTRIALRTRSHELNYYYYHHWAVKPSQSVADVVYEFGEQTDVFRQLFRGISYNPDYLITGQVKSIERIEEKNASFAHLSLQLELLNAESEVTVVQHEIDQTLPLEEGTMNEFAQQISEIILMANQEFFAQVSTYLTEQQNDI